MELWLSVILAGSAYAGRAPEGMKEFNKLCPAPKACAALSNGAKSCRTRKSCTPFIDAFKSLAPSYDCQRPEDHAPGDELIVPAVWLCDENVRWDALKLLSSLKDPAAVSFFASKAFRDTLDGDSAETYYQKSLAVQRRLNRKPR